MRLIVTQIDKGRKVKQITTESQVCAALWDEDTRGILTAHGFSKYQLSLWNLSSEQLMYEFVGHKNRVLTMVRPPGSDLVITGSADETIRLWNMKRFTRRFGKESSKIAPLSLR